MKGAKPMVEAKAVLGTLTAKMSRERTNFQNRNSVY